MSYSAAERSPVDVDEFERRMRAPGGRSQSDPLAELARLVNASEDRPDALDDMFARPVAGRAGHHEGRDGAGIDLDALRGPYVDHDQFDAHHGAVGEVEHAGGDYGVADAIYEGAPASTDDWSVPHSFERAVPDTHAPRSRKPLYAAAAVIAVGVLGIGSTFAFKGSRTTGGDIVEVKAAPGPVKVAAQTGPDRTNGVAESTVLDRNTTPQPVTRVIDRQERPVDLKDASRAAPRMVSTTQTSSSQMASLAAGITASGDNGGSVFAEPRKVKTVAVRPDGTVVSNTATDASASASSNAGTNATAAVKGATPKAAARIAPGTTPKPVDKPEAAARTVTAKADSTATPAAVKPVAPKPVAAKPVRTARTTEPADGDDSADNDATAARTRTTASGGGFSVQLAAPGSEAEAKSTASRLSQKYSDALGGTRVTFQKAADKSVYRVRAAGMSRDDAVSACEKIKAAGGACFVAKN